ANPPLHRRGGLRAPEGLVADLRADAQPDGPGVCRQLRRGRVRRLLGRALPGPDRPRLEPRMSTTITPDVEAKRPDKRWYVIHTYSGYENKVKANLEHRIESMGMEDKIFQ